MKQFVLKPEARRIPKHRMNDVIRLRNFIVAKMNTQISLMDTYLLWDRISTTFSAGWLMFDFDDWNFSEPPVEFLERYMGQFGYITGDDDEEDDY